MRENKDCGLCASFPDHSCRTPEPTVQLDVIMKGGEEVFLIVEVIPHAGEITELDWTTAVAELCEAAALIGIPQSVTYSLTAPKNKKNPPV